jgi:hypothetical protein
VTAVALAALRRGSAHARYVVSCLGLLLMGLLPIVSAIWNAPDRAPAFTSASAAAAETRSAGESPGIADAAAITTAVPASSWSRANLEAWLPVAVVLWLAGIVGFSLRMLIGWVHVERIRRRGTRPAAAALACVGRLASELRISRPVALLSSALVEVPTVVGWLRPVILLPVSALSGLSPAQIEAVLAHELAHVRRHDYFINLLQTIVETLLFYHPAVWWISSRIRTERELLRRHRRRRLRRSHCLCGSTGRPGGTSQKRGPGPADHRRTVAGAHSPSARFASAVRPPVIDFAADFECGRSSSLHVNETSRGPRLEAAPCDSGAGNCSPCRSADTACTADSGRPACACRSANFACAIADTDESRRPRDAFVIDIGELWSFQYGMRSAQSRDDHAVPGRP